MSSLAHLILSETTIEELKKEKVICRANQNASNPPFLQIRLRIENEKYLRAHPEIKQIIQYFIKETLVTQPEDIEKFAIGEFVA